MNGIATSEHTLLDQINTARNMADTLMAIYRHLARDRSAPRRTPP